MVHSLAAVLGRKPNSALGDTLQIRSLAVPANRTLPTEIACEHQSGRLAADVGDPAIDQRTLRRSRLLPHIVEEPRGCQNSLQQDQSCGWLYVDHRDPNREPAQRNRIAVFPGSFDPRSGGEGRLCSTTVWSTLKPATPLRTSLTRMW